MATKLICYEAEADPKQSVIILIQMQGADFRQPLVRRVSRESESRRKHL